jgi:putative DNA primase/helicase
VIGAAAGAAPQTELQALMGEASARQAAAKAKKISPAVQPGAEDEQPKQAEGAAAGSEGEAEGEEFWSGVGQEAGWGGSYQEAKQEAKPEHETEAERSEAALVEVEPEPERPGAVKLAQGVPYDIARIFVAQRHMRAGRVVLWFWEGRFWSWNGRHYEAMTDKAVRDQVYGFLGTSMKYDGSRFKPRPKDTNEVLDVLRSVLGLNGPKYQPPMWLDSGGRAGELMAFRNGVVDLRTGRLMPPSPVLWSHAAVDYEWDPEASCERWEQFLGEVFPGDVESQQFVEEWIGYCMTEDVRYHKGALLIGKRRSGKGTIIWVLEQLVGKSGFVGLSVHEWTRGFGSECLIGKRAGCFPDVRLKPPKQYGDNLDAGGMPHQSVELMLRITGGDAVTIGRKNEKVPWQGVLPTKLTLVSNEVLNFNDAVLTTRFNMLFFGVCFEEGGRQLDVDLKEKLRAELPGIAVRCVAALARLRARRGFVQPASAGGLKRQVQSVADPFAAWVMARYEPDPAGRVKIWQFRAAMQEALASRQDVLAGLGDPLLKARLRAVPGFEDVRGHHPHKQKREYLGLREKETQ